MAFHFSFIIPVYNRPGEVKELLSSFQALKGNITYDIVIVEDGSKDTSESVVDSFKSKLDITYFYKENSGPGDSRNFGMSRAKGNYFIILDSDCILPQHYLEEVEKSLETDFVDCFGGPDASHKSFTNLQKAIDFSMTSLITTGGIRGGENSVNTFQPRSFNMGLSKKAFEASGGFGRIHPGEDPDLSIRLWDLGYKTKLIPKAFVYHKRRISWRTFYNQVKKFGMVRPILNVWHPSTKKITYWFPTMFIIGLFVAIVLCAFHFYIPIWGYVAYFFVAIVLALFKTKSLSVALLTVPAIIIQFFGYGLGFLKSTFIISVLNRNPEKQFPNLFFNSK